MNSRSATRIDEYVGNRMRMRRILVGMSQEKLGEQLGLTFQQIQKYERATNRISASRLFDIARILEVPIAYFYEGLDEAGDAASVDTSFDYLADGQASAEGVRLNRAFQRIGDTNVQKRIVELVNALADAPSED
ncbi:MAG: helix-turn-helix transcriptional regulator [Rhodobiaceae bacterium]|nr:helix-turn-helix transcriptional regulator [Rhodobiaceae bacterium]MCC0055376.1 helix-turn-helix transcriptional regulator [Rhodobiaceae bacterium]